MAYEDLILTRYLYGLKEDEELSSLDEVNNDELTHCGSFLFQLLLLNPVRSQFIQQLSHPPKSPSQSPFKCQLPIFDFLQIFKYAFNLPVSEFENLRSFRRKRPKWSDPSSGWGREFHFQQCIRCFLLLIFLLWLSFFVSVLIFLFTYSMRLILFLFKLCWVIAEWHEGWHIIGVQLCSYWNGVLHNKVRSVL